MSRGFRGTVLDVAIVITRAVNNMRIQFSNGGFIESLSETGQTENTSFGKGRCYFADPLDGSLLILEDGEEPRKLTEWSEEDIK